MSALLDLSKFRQNLVVDSAEDLKKINEMTDSFIGEGSHEVIVIGIHSKKDSKFELTDHLGGSLGFTFVVQNQKKQEKMIYMRIPLAVTFFQAVQSNEKNEKFLFRRVVKNLISMGIDPSLFRESIIHTNGDSINLLKGTQFLLINTWSDKKIHLQYDANDKCNYFVKSNGERFEEGELAHPYQVDMKVDIKDRYNKFIFLAKEHHYQFEHQMNVQIEPHPTANNDKINELLKRSTPNYKKDTKNVEIGCEIPDELNIDPPKKTLIELDDDDEIMF